MCSCNELERGKEPVSDLRPFKLPALPPIPPSTKLRLWQGRALPNFAAQLCLLRAFDYGTLPRVRRAEQTRKQLKERIGAPQK